MGKKKRKSIPTTQPKNKNLGGNCGTISARDLCTHSKARMDSTMMSARTEILDITDAKQKQK